MKRNSSSTCGRRGCGAFTLLELPFVIAIFAAMLLPALSRAKAEAQQASCTSIMRTWGLDTMMCAGHFSDRLPLFDAESADYTREFRHARHLGFKQLWAINRGTRLVTHAFWYLEG